MTKAKIVFLTAMVTLKMLTVLSIVFAWLFGGLYMINTPEIFYWGLGLTIAPFIVIGLALLIREAYDAVTYRNK